MLNILVVSSLSNLTQYTFDVTYTAYHEKKFINLKQKKNKQKTPATIFFVNYNFFRKGLLQRCLVPYIKKLIENTFTREGWGDVWQIMQGK